MSLLIQIGMSIVGAAVIAASHLLVEAPTISERKALIAPPPDLEYFSFGFQFPLADNLWIRTIQDIDFCEHEIAKQKCQSNGWLFQMVDTIVTLAPDYLIAYNEGGVVLSVLLSDVTGAAEIYRKGLAVFPKDFRLIYRAATHAYIEEKNKAKAASLYLRAAQVDPDQPSWLYSLATRMYSDAGEREAALQIYQNLKDQGLEDSILKRMREKLGISAE